MTALVGIMKMERFAWILALMAVAFWGSRRQAPPAAEQAGQSARLSRPGAAAGDRTFREGRPDRVPETRAVTAQRAEEALRHPDPLARTAEFLSLLAACDREGLERIAATMEQLQATGLSLGVEAELVNFRAGQLRGGELLTGRTGNAEDLAVAGSLRKQFEGWLQASPTEARQWLDRLPEGKFRDQMAISCIAASAKDDPTGTLHRAALLPPSQQAVAGRTAAERWSRTASSDEISHLLITLPTQSATTGSPYLTALFDTLAGTPDADLLMDALPSSVLEQPYVSGASLARAATTRASLDPVAALDWAASVEPRKGELPSGSLLTAAVHGMTLEGLAKAEQWAASHPDAAGLPATIALRRTLLENRGDDSGEYDRDD